MFINDIIKFLTLGVSALNSFRTQISNEDRDNAYWGTETTSNDTSIQNFTIDYPEGVITDLKYRLNNRRNFTAPLKDAAFTYGFNTDALDGWLDYWANNYNFSDRLAVLNQFPQYTTMIQGLKIHFLWVKPNVTSDVEVIPLLLLHGWPGCFVEFLKAIPYLTSVSSDRSFAVEVIVPSLPGFAYSDATTVQGLGGTEMATVLRNLMKRLGYSKYYVQGGDWGSFVGSMIATLYPKECLGYHTNFPISFNPFTYVAWFAGSLAPSFVVDSSVEDRLYPLTTIFRWLLTETGYLHSLATKPDTVGIGMADSPAAQLSYILQLVSMASRRENVNKTNGGLDMYSQDELLDIQTVYWSTVSFTTSSRIYAETLNVRNFKEGTLAIPTSVPTWSVHTKNEMIYQSPLMLKFKFPNLINSTIYEDWGHFFALEQPEVFSDNVLTALAAFRDWHKSND